ncbi:HlyD family efflux transporter periplasmic adaptor subunit [Actinotalea sp.]|uniref:HlyD family efflux transporter periplasmic adaptor subunit n=1 Tax=Actinotalea sp. TaxID=1872145 RepID=UPI00356460E0
MSWANRARLALGLLAVLAVVAAGTMHLNASRGIVPSTSAQIAAESATVATPYSGLVIDQLVEVGDEVVEGQPLFLLDSANLQRDVAMGAVPERTVETSVDEEGYLLVRATVDGTVTAVEATPGTYVRESVVLASVERSGSLQVGAQFLLSSEQYARLAPHAAVDIVLPGGRELVGEVSDVAVATEDGKAQVVVTVDSDALLEAQGEDRLVADGVPVTVRLHLENDGWVTEVTAAVRGALADVADRVTGASGGSSS